MKTKATKEVIEQYKKDIADAMQLKDEMEQLNAINDIEMMAEHYDWDNQVFVDEKTGKKGLRDVEGKVLVPALYDEFPEVGSYRLFRDRPHVAVKDGKFGIVAADGTGKALTAFMYTYLKWDYYSPLFLAQWGDVKELAGLIFEDGQVLLPCCVKKLTQPWNNIYCYDGMELKGLIDLSTMQATMPLFEEIDFDPETELVTVKKDGVEGVLTATGLQFVPMSEYDEENGEYLHEEPEF